MFKNKYLKYKNKYLNLKQFNNNLKGGGDVVTEVPDELKLTVPDELKLPIPDDWEDNWNDTIKKVSTKVIKKVTKEDIKKVTKEDIKKVTEEDTEDNWENIFCESPEIPPEIPIVLETEKSTQFITEKDTITNPKIQTQIKKLLKLGLIQQKKDRYRMTMSKLFTGDTKHGHNNVITHDNIDAYIDYIPTYINNMYKQFYDVIKNKLPGQIFIKNQYIISHILQCPIKDLYNIRKKLAQLDTLEEDLSEAQILDFISGDSNDEGLSFKDIINAKMRKQWGNNSRTIMNYMDKLLLFVWSQIEGNTKDPMCKYFKDYRQSNPILKAFTFTLCDLHNFLHIKEYIDKSYN